MRYAVIENGIVANIALADAEYAAEMGWIEAGDATIGMTYDGTAFGPAPAPSIDDARATAWAAVKLRRAQLEFGGCDTPFGRVQTDPESTTKINGLTTLALIAQAGGQPFEVGFSMADNSVVVLDATEAITMGATVGGYVGAVYAHSFALRAQIDAAVDLAALAAIDLLLGWPGA